MGIRVLAIAIWLVFCLRIPCHGADMPLEYQVKANYLVNLPRFVELPNTGRSCSQFTICLIGETPLAKALESHRGKQIRQRPLVIKTVADFDQMDCCMVLFIASSERFQVQPLLAEAGRRGILTISDMRDFVRLGGMIGLLTVNNRVVFDLNQSAAHRAAISFDTQLLKLANDISK